MPYHTQPFQEIHARGYFFTHPNSPLEERRFEIDAVSENDVVVRVAGCGLCHTDLRFLSGEVKTKQAPPLILGHEISGTVIGSGSRFSDLENRSVIVPAVLPCGECELCADGRDNICQNQKMPGNDIHGGFATHVVVPGKFLCLVPERVGALRLSQLSVIADAVTTPYQSLKKSHLKKGDLAIVIGVGGIGIYMVQHAANVGATVIAMDISEQRLKIARSQGAHHVLCVDNLPEKNVKEEVRRLVKTHELPRYQWKIFETSGSIGGQSLAYSLLTFASVLGIVGFTLEKLTVRLGNVMAFDADIFGNWGCRPGHYAEVVDQVLSGKIDVLSNITEYPLDSINDVISRARAHELEKRPVLVPRDV